MKTVSVITPVWNRSDLTTRFLQQNWMALGHHAVIEWIIVDNGSTDDTPQILDHWKGIIGNRLKIITLPENIGFGPGNNRGVELATGDILAFISNDVQVLGDYLTPIKKLFSYSQEPALWGPEVHSHNTGWNTFKNVGPIVYVAGWCVIIDRELWRLKCAWDERFVPCDFEDIDLSYQMTQAGGNCKKIMLPLRHGGTGNSGQNLAGGRLATTMASQKKFIEKWGLDA